MNVIDRSPTTISQVSVQTGKLRDRESWSDTAAIALFLRRYFLRAIPRDFRFTSVRLMDSPATGVAVPSGQRKEVTALTEIAFDLSRYLRPSENGRISEKASSPFHRVVGINFIHWNFQSAQSQPLTLRQPVFLPFDRQPLISSPASRPRLADALSADKTRSADSIIGNLVDFLLTQSRRGGAHGEERRESRRW